MNQLQSIYKLFWTDLLKPLRDHLAWKRISKDVRQCYYQASRLVKYTYGIVLSYLLRAYVSRHISRYNDRIRDVPPVDLLCDLVSDYKTFLTDTLDSNDEHTKLIVNVLFISGDFLEFVAAYRNQDSVMVEVGYKTFALIWKLLGQNKYLEATWEQMDALYNNYPFSRLQEVLINCQVRTYPGASGKSALAQDKWLELNNKEFSNYPMIQTLNGMCCQGKLIGVTQRCQGHI